MFELFLTLHQYPAGNWCPLVGISAAAARAALPNLSRVCGALVLTYIVMQYELSVNFAKAAWKFPLLFSITNCPGDFLHGRPDADTVATSVSSPQTSVIPQITADFPLPLRFVLSRLDIECSYSRKQIFVSRAFMFPVMVPVKSKWSSSPHMQHRRSSQSGRQWDCFTHDGDKLGVNVLWWKHSVIVS